MRKTWKSLLIAENSRSAGYWHSVPFWAFGSFPDVILSNCHSSLASKTPASLLSFLLSVVLSPAEPPRISQQTLTHFMYLALFRCPRGLVFIFIVLISRAMTRGWSVFCWLWGFKAYHVVSILQNAFWPLGSTLLKVVFVNASKHQPDFQPNFSLPSSDFQILTTSLSRGHCLFIDWYWLFHKLHLYSYITFFFFCLDCGLLWAGMFMDSREYHGPYSLAQDLFS